MIQVSQFKAKITPRGRFFPITMPNGRWSEEIADEQYVSVLALKKEEQTLIWICLDAIGTGEKFSASVREKLSEKFNVPFENINIGYTHSHCAPRLGEGRGQMAKSDESYMDFVQDKIVDTVERCMKQKFSETEAYVKTYDALGFYSNRNGLDKIGDNAMQVLEFRTKENEVKGLALIYACHSTVVNFQISRAVTSDLGGYLARGLEKRYGLYPVIMLGAAGDMSNRCCRQGNDYNELVRVGEGLLSRMAINVPEEKLNIDRIEVESYQFKETYVTTKEERQKQIENIKEKIANAPTADLRRVFGSALEHAAAEPDGGEFTMDVKGVIIRLGDIEICTMPAELFSCFGLEIKKSMPVKCPIFWGYSNYSVGYLYNKEEAGKSFESAATNIPVGVPEEITAMLCERVK